MIWIVLGGTVFALFVIALLGAMAMTDPKGFAVTIGVVILLGASGYSIFYGIQQIGFK